MNSNSYISSKLQDELVRVMYPQFYVGVWKIKQYSRTIPVVSPLA